MAKSKEFYEGVKAAAGESQNPPYAEGTQERIDWIEGCTRALTLDIVELHPELTSDEVDQMLGD